MIEAKRVGNGVLITAACGLTAEPEPGWVPVATSVWCESNGAVSRVVTLPGAVAATDLESVTTTEPVVLCVHGYAVFSPTIGAPQSATVDFCFEATID